VAYLIPPGLDTRALKSSAGKDFKHLVNRVARGRLLEVALRVDAAVAETFVGQRA
jgi:hypothetical protein